MAECAGTRTCPFFNDKMQAMPNIARMMKKHFCEEDFTHCARFMVKQKLGPERVPADLYPNQSDKAERLINAAGVLQSGDALSASG